MSSSDLPWPGGDRRPDGDPLAAGDQDPPGDRHPLGDTPPAPDGQPGTTGKPAAAVPAPEASTFYDEIGGHQVFEGIVHRFYRRVREDSVLSPLYPPEDLLAAEVRLRMFLEQYWGGPRTYSEQRGHPRLRMRHAPFAIGRAEHDAWLAAMREAIDGAGLTPEQDARLWAYLVMAADSMINSAH